MYKISIILYFSLLQLKLIDKQTLYIFYVINFLKQLIFIYIFQRDLFIYLFLFFNDTFFVLNNIKSNLNLP